MKISLVIPVKNEEKSLRRLLGSISRQTRLPDEVIFVNAGSRDKTKYIIENYEDNRIDIWLINTEPLYPGIARNRGVEKAKYDTIAFTDGGIDLDKNWLAELTRTMDDGNSTDVVYGNYTAKTDTFYKECLALAFMPPLKLRDGEKLRYFIASSLMKKSVHKAVGGFPNFRAGEDRIFIDKIKEKGFKIKYNSRAIVKWDIPDNIRGTFDRFYNFSYHDLTAGRAGSWHMPVLKMYIIALGLISLGIFLSPLFFLILITGFLFRATHKIIANKDEPYFKLQCIPLYFIIGGFLIIFIDMAMFLGWIKWIKRNI